MDASIRTADRAVIQIGTSLADRSDATIVELTAQEQTDLAAAYAQPHGNVYLAADGTVTFDPYVAPPPPADQTQFDAAVAKLRTTFGTSRSVADVNLCLDALTVVCRRLFQALQ